MTLPKIQELLDLTGRTAVVTGGAQGIGLGIAQRLGEAGAKVVLADLDEQALENAAKLLDQDGVDVAGIRADVSDEASVTALFTTVAERFGCPDILVNNAGIFPIVPAMQMPTAQFDQVIAVNLRGVFLTTKEASRRMIERGEGGRVVNITSIDALHPSAVGLAAYDASKHGVLGLTRNLALELAPHRIWVNAVAPGGVATPGAVATEEVAAAFAERVPAGRMGVPDDIATAVLFLATGLSSYMTGSQVVVDGGMLLR